MNPVAPLGRLYLSIQIENVFAYGRSTGTRTHDKHRMKVVH